MSRIADGEYIAKIKEAGFRLVKSGKEMAYISISVYMGEESLALTWYGSLATEKSRAFVLKTFKAINPSIQSWDDISDGLTLEPGTEIKATLENKINDQTGVEFVAVKFINPTKMTINPKALSFLKKGEPKKEEDLPF